MVTYDSRPDTFAHALVVAGYCDEIARQIEERGNFHDASKMEEPELAVFNEFTPKLKESTYGSEEYKEYLKEMGAGLAHHYENNRHHPEHFKNGINDMTLVDLVEMLCDWKAATQRHDNGDLKKSLEIQKDRFGISEQLAGILENTAKELGWL